MFIRSITIIMSTLFKVIDFVALSISMVRAYLSFHLVLFLFCCCLAILRFYRTPLYHHLRTLQYFFKTLFFEIDDKSLGYMFSCDFYHHVMGAMVLFLLFYQHLYNVVQYLLCYHLINL